VSLFTSPEEHDANPPSTWEVVKMAERVWHLRSAGSDYPLDTFTTKRAAETARTNGSAATLYAMEDLWYRGAEIPGWRMWADVKAERERHEAWLASKAESEA
jgi:hypothetical protein